MRFLNAIAGGSLCYLIMAPTSLRAGMIIDFEDVPGGTGLVTTVSSGGFTFEASNDVFLIVGDGSGGSENGTQTLYYLGDGIITMFRGDRATFDLVEADLGEGNGDLPSSVISVTGMILEGGSISAIETLNGILSEFETVTFSGFTDLVSVTFDGNSNIGFSLDNIIVPEPSTLSLLILAGLLGVKVRWGRYRRILCILIPLGVVCTGGATQVQAQWTGGPVLIGGDDTDHHFTSLGDSYIREGFSFLGLQVTNGNTLAVCIGCNAENGGQK